MTSNLDASEPPTLEKLLAQVKTKGARVNNLLHRMDGMWQCNLRSRDAQSYFQYGFGPTPNDAVRSAIAKFETGQRVLYHNPTDDERDPRMVGSTKEASNPIPASELGGADDVEIDDLLS